MKKKDVSYYFALFLASGITHRGTYVLCCTKCGSKYNQEEDIKEWDKEHEHKRKHWYEFWK